MPEYFDLEYYNQLSRILGVDQAIRKKDYMRRLISDSVQRATDSLNLEILYNLIKEKGFPNYEDYGFEFDEVVVLLMHEAMYSDTMFNKVVYLIEEGRKKGLLAKSFIGMLTDRRLDWMYNQNLQYGLWFLTQKSIDEIETVDERLYKMNSISFRDVYRIIQTEVPDGYKNIPYPKNYFCEHLSE